MLNGDFLHRQSEAFAMRIKTQAGANLENQIKLAFNLAFSRTPTPDEIQKAIGFIDKLKADHKLDADQALGYFCLFVYNLNEFIYVD
jgi:hypothetical protein